MSIKYKILVSYHRDENDIYNNFYKKDYEYKDKFKKICSNNFDIVVSNNFQDYHLNSSIITVVLIGNKTWEKKYVDKEISLRLNERLKNPKNGLIGIILPTYEDKKNGIWAKNSTEQIQIENSIYVANKNTIPKKLALNIDNGFVKLYNWSNNPDDIKQYINEYFKI